jgi:hypothetical protein
LGPDISKPILVVTLALNPACAVPALSFSEIAAAVERLVRTHGPRDADLVEPYHDLVGAGLAVLRGDLDAAAAGYRSAALGLDAADTTTVANAARWRLGELLGGDDGRALVEQARAALLADGIVRPDRVVATYAPVAADARRP